MRIPTPKISVWHLYVALVVFALGMIGAIGHVWLSSARVSAEHLPLARASARVKLDATLAHLWFEEILNGDRHQSMEQVWNLLESARWHARAMVEGGEDPDGAIVPLRDPELRRRILDVEEKLSEFETITFGRRDARQDAASGSDIDQRYDAVFGELVALMDAVERDLHEVIRSETRSVRRTQILVAAGVIVAAILFGAVVTGYSRERERAERSLQQKVRAEKEAREHLDELAHVLRLATMNELAAEIAHEIRQPLAAVSASAAACRRWVDASDVGSEKFRLGLTMIGNEAQRASDVLHRLRVFVEKRESRYEFIDVNELVTSVVTLADFDPRMRKATIRLGLTDNLPPAEADAVQIQQVLLNLMRNGVEAMQRNGTDPGGELLVRTRLVEENEIEVSVVDNGPGFAAEIARHPFRPFVTTKESGMGLGLSISRSIVAAHGGRIRFSNNGESRGATVAFTLPVAGGTGT